MSRIEILADVLFTGIWVLTRSSLRTSEQTKDLWPCKAIISSSTTARVVNAALIMTICRLQRFTLCSDDGFAAAACMGTGYRGGCCQRSHHFDNGRGLDKGTGTTMDVISSTLMIGWPQAQAQTAVILPATLVAAVLPQCHNNWLDTVPLHHANNGRWTSNIIMEMIMEISLRSSWIWSGVISESISDIISEMVSEMISSR